MSAASTEPWATFCLKRRTTSTPNTAAAMAALFTAAFQVGGRSSRSARRFWAICLASVAVRGRPVRPARSIVPAGVPRCLRVRFRRVWAIDPGTLLQRRQGFLQNVALRREAAERNVLRKAVERGPRRETDQLGLGHRRAGSDSLDYLAERHRPVVVHVGRYLRPTSLAEVEPERAHPGKAGAVRLAQLRGDRLRQLHVLARQVDVER